MSEYPRCPHCNRMFKPIRRTQSYCSPQCKHAAYKRRARQRIDTSDIPEAGPEWFAKAKLKQPTEE